MSDPQHPSGAGAGAPSEEELRAAYEAELERITALDMIAQAAVSLLNIGARRIGQTGPPAPGEQAPPSGGRDLEQVRDAIDAASGLLAVLERRMPREVGPLKDALSRLQMAYAQEVGQAAAGEPAGPGTQQPGEEPKQSGEPARRSAEQAPQEDAEQGERRPGPAEASGRLWVPGR